MKEPDIDVKMDGKQYLDYIKYKDSTRRPLFSSPRAKFFGVYYTLLFGGAFIIALIIQEMFAPPVVSTPISTAGVLGIALILVAVGFTIHGPALVRVSR